MGAETRIGNDSGEPVFEDNRDYVDERGIKPASLEHLGVPPNRVSSAAVEVDENGFVVLPQDVRSVGEPVFSDFSGNTVQAPGPVSALGHQVATAAAVRLSAAC